MTTIHAGGGSELRLESWDMPAAELGPENPLPPLHKRREVSPHPGGAARGADCTLAYNDYGRGGTMLPYRMQDSYGRARRPRRFKALVLENAHLRATFLPELGGRLWSLIHRRTGRELLYCNPVFQPANLAYRNAWFSGGVEWNVSLMAHSPHTCSPLFAGWLRAPSGSPVLRLWEWDRVRRVAYQVEAWLPADAQMLRVRWKVVNPHARVIPMYSWSNVAVPETADTRVLAPAASAFVRDYRNPQVLVETPVPLINGRDISYPTNAPMSKDYYFHVPASQRPWITAVRQDGGGVIQASTSRQRGRKLFVWGMSQGGRHWQEFLSVPGQPYIEIQAGLARTQAESLPMPPGAEWSWLETYGLVQADPSVTHAADWAAACAEVNRRLDALLAGSDLEDELRRTAPLADAPPVEILHRGSGWGALERRRREQAGEPPGWPPGIRFDDAPLGEDQKPWLALLETGRLPTAAPTAAPGAFMTAAPWRRMLAKSIRNGSGNQWLAWFHLGVMAFDAYPGNRTAIEAWERSIEHEPNPWAYRCLAMVAMRNKDFQRAAGLYLTACSLLPELQPLATETCRALNACGRHEEVMALIRRMPPHLRRSSGILLSQAAAAVGLGDCETALTIVTGEHEFESIREGEATLTDLWFKAHELRIAKSEGIPVNRRLRIRVRRECPPPQRIDFRGFELSPEHQAELEGLKERRIERRLARLSERQARQSRR